MPIESKRIVKNTGILYFRMLFLMAVNLYTSRILLSALGVVDFGLYNVIGGVVLMLGFLKGTMSTASARFVTVTLSKGDIHEMKRIFSSILFVNILLAGIILLLAETIGIWFLLEKMTIPEHRLTASMWVYQFSVLSVALNVLTVPYNATIIAHEKMGAFAYISIFDISAKLIIVYLIIASHFDRLIFYGLLTLLVNVIDVLIYVCYCLRNFHETRVNFKYDNSITKEIFSFITWASYGSFVSVGYTQGLNIILNLFFGPAVNAARGIAVQVQHAVLNFTTNFQTAINPQLMKATAERRLQDSQKLLVFSSKFSFFLLCILFLPLIVETPLVLGVWLKDVPDYTVSFCRLILTISIMEALANPLRIVNQAEGNIKKFQLCECTLLMLIMPVSYFILKIYKIPILVFVVHLVIEIVAHFIRVVIVVPKIQMTFADYMKQVYLRLTPIFILSLLLSFSIQRLLSRENVFLSYLLVIIVSEIALLFFITIFGLNRNERTFLSKSMKKYIHKWCF